jgi:hypothetical protein
VSGSLVRLFYTRLNKHDVLFRVELSALLRPSQHEVVSWTDVPRPSENSDSCYVRRCARSILFLTEQCVP